MQCPLCLDTPLEPKYVGATEVDICPRCRGIWLDRGELDRLLDDEGRPRPDERTQIRRDDRPDGSWERELPSQPKKQKKQKSKAKRLADLFEEVLDL